MPAASAASSIDRTVTEIAARARDREAEERLPFEVIDLVRRSGLGALRLPFGVGGAGFDGRELFAFLIDLAEADADAAHALRAHYAFVEMALTSGDADARRRWLELVAAGRIFGNAITEIGANVADGLTFETKVATDGEGLRLDGTKYFSTGALLRLPLGAGRGRRRGDPAGDRAERPRGGDDGRRLGRDRLLAWA